MQFGQSHSALPSDQDQSLKKKRDDFNEYQSYEVPRGGTTGAARRAGDYKMKDYRLGDDASEQERSWRGKY